MGKSRSVLSSWTQEYQSGLREMALPHLLQASPRCGASMKTGERQIPQSRSPDLCFLVPGQSRSGCDSSNNRSLSGRLSSSKSLRFFSSRQPTTDATATAIIRNSSATIPRSPNPAISLRKIPGAHSVQHPSNASAVASDMVADSCSPMGFSKRLSGCM